MRLGCVETDLAARVPRGFIGKLKHIHGADRGDLFSPAQIVLLLGDNCPVYGGCRQNPLGPLRQQTTTAWGTAVPAKSNRAPAIAVVRDQSDRGELVNMLWS